MIKRVEALYYKGFKYIAPELMNYNILVGPNASGKSSLLDIFIFLKDVLNESPVAAVEKRCSNFRELIWNQGRNYFELALEFHVPPEMNNLYTSARYEISLTYSDKDGIIIDNENLWLLKPQNGKITKSNSLTQMYLFPHEPEAPEHIIQQRKNKPIGWKKIVSKSTKGNDYFKSESTDWNIIYRFGPRKASLARIPEDETRFPISLWVKNILMEGIEFLQLNSVDMRWPCRPDAPVTFEPSGSNISKVVKYLKENNEYIFDRWVEHVKTALPDVEDVEVKERTEDRFLYLVIRYQNGISIPSWLQSDGTLRLLAQTLIAYLPVQDKLYIIEEPENGLHPQAIETVVQSLSSVYDNQIILATHSPVVLRLAEPKDILCFSKTETGAVDIVRGNDHPRLKDWKMDVDLATLHAAGVLQ
ncbi:ATP-binding protein [candidate division KSB1 bacterium]|nr:ATP-binding protein [candidate division KSB1 bacterium]MBL7094173.1 ATP-binding protein [candidate division KSB1 bacterium]